jgi:heme-degrading monooxygenase HmoA
MPFIKPLPKSNYFAVIFSSTKSESLEGYVEADELTMHLASEQKGFIGYESLSCGSKTIFISYWESRESIDAWRLNSTHQLAKSNAKKWYKRYLSQVCHVENSHLYEV